MGAAGWRSSTTRGSGVFRAFSGAAVLVRCAAAGAFVFGAAFGRGGGSGLRCARGSAFFAGSDFRRGRVSGGLEAAGFGVAGAGRSG